MVSKEDSTDGTTSETEKAVRAVREVGGVRSSDDFVPDLWFGQHAEERRDATCSADVKSSKGRGDGPRGRPAPDKVRKLQITLYRKAKSKPEYRLIADPHGSITLHDKGTRKAGCGKTACPV